VPITSFGIIAFRVKSGGQIEYLMIRRKDSLGYVDFMRGKYSIYNKDYIQNMIFQMTNVEKERLLANDFDTLWNDLWGETSMSEQYRNEENISRDKFNSLCSGISINGNSYSLKSLIEHSNKIFCWEEAEWGFPKGRRNYQERDYDCALREFCEETGYSKTDMILINNLLPYEETFTGSNYKSYKHKYYLNYMDYDKSMKKHNIQTSEIGLCEWKTYDECIKCIRSYNLEKLHMLNQIHNTLTQNRFYIE
jgi:hypothetical protein